MRSITMFRHTFKIRKDKNSEPVEFTTDMPKTLDDLELIEARFGTVERMIDRANSQWTVDVAVGTRKRLPDEHTATQYAENYCDDGRKDSFAPRKLNADKAQEEAGFNAEQIAWLKAQGHIA